MVEDQIVTHKKSQRSVVLFFYAMVTFLLWNVLSTWWIAYVSFGGMILISVLNSLLMACVWWLMHLVHRKWAGPTGYFALIVFWLTFEYLHFHWAIQWPWLTLGNGFSNSVELIQWYEYTGVLGGSLWVLLINILLFSLFKSLLSRKVYQSVQLLAFILLLILLPVGSSLYRYSTYSEKSKSIEVVLLQPNIDPFSEKFSALSAGEQTRRLITLAKTSITDSTRYVLAPETALATMWEEGSLKQNEALKSIDSLVKKYPQIRFIAGAITQKKLDVDDLPSYATRRTEGGEPYDVFNSALLIDHSPTVQIGHKSILVSGVEKMPFQKYFSFLGKYAVHVGGTSGSLSSAGQPSVFEGADREKVASVICFESVFGGFVSDAVRKGASVIFVMTNDGWWKDSPGVSQHFAFSRLRAVETRRSIVRSANTGISGFINERGDVLKKTKVNTSVAVNCQIHVNHSITFYTTYGDYLGWISFLLSGLMAIYFLMVFLRSRS